MKKITYYFINIGSVRKKPFGTLIITPGSPTMLIQTAVHPPKATALQIPAAVIHIQSLMWLLPSVVTHTLSAVIHIQSFMWLLPTQVIRIQAVVIHIPTLLPIMVAAVIHIPTLLPIMVAAVTQAMMNFWVPNSKTVP